MHIDMHVHSRCSRDSANSEELLIKMAKEKNLGFAITDHNNARAWARIEELAKKSKVDVIFGEEIMVVENGYPKGEILGYFMNSEIKPADLGTVLDALKEQDALAFVAHPFDFFRRQTGKKRLLEIKNRVDGIEVYNARCYSKLFNERALKFAEKFKLSKVAGSDAHFPEEFGNAFTIFEANSLEEVRKALKEGKTSVYGGMSSLTVHVKTQLRKYGLIGVKK